MKVRNAIRRLILVASIVYGVGVCLLWARSHYRSDALYIELGVLSPPAHIEISSGNGILHTDLNHCPPPINSAEVRYLSFPIEDARDFDRLNALGGGPTNERFDTPICWRSGRTWSGKAWIFVNIPHWLALVAVGPLWLWLLFRCRKRARSRREGFCLACGYNLTGNVSGVCPECGAPIEAECEKPCDSSN